MALPSMTSDVGRAAVKDLNDLARIPRNETENAAIREAFNY